MGIVSSPRSLFVSDARALRDLQPNLTGKTHVLSRRTGKATAMPKMSVCLPFRLRSKSSIFEAHQSQRKLELAPSCLLPLQAMKSMTTGGSVRLFVNLQMLLIEHDSISYPVERQCQAAAKTLVHFEIPVVVVTLKLGAAEKPS